MEKKNFIKYSKILGLFLLLFMSFSGKYLSEFEFEDKKIWLLGFISLCIYTFVSMIVPFVLCLINKDKISINKGLKICKYNFIGTLIVFVFIDLITMAGDKIIENLGSNFVYLGVYYFINKWLFVEESEITKKDKVKRQNKTQKQKNNKTQNTVYCKKCGGQLDIQKKCTKCGKQYFYIKNKSLLFVIPLTILLISSIVLNVKFYNEKQALFEVGETFYEANVDLENEYENLNEKYDKLRAKYSKVEDKAKFLDENIVFVLEGYGNKYYTYDCVQEITNGEYTYWAFNVEAARSQGYKKGTCN